VLEDFLEDFMVEFSDVGLGDEQVEPWVGCVPDAFGFCVLLHTVHT